MNPFDPHVDSPMYVVTTGNHAEVSGCLVGFATQCSIDPPRFLVCLSVANHTYAVADVSGSLAVHLLTDHDRELAELFGEQTGDEVDKFASIPWEMDESSGVPVLTQCAASFVGSIVSKVPFGDHVGFVLAPVEEFDASAELNADQLTLRDVEDLEPGHDVDDEPAA
jgi:flavin reductase (DIM6/NTAB) family NADH-FMN oxidoreductase RutF